MKTLLALLLCLSSAASFGATAGAVRVNTDTTGTNTIGTNTIVVTGTNVAFRGGVTASVLVSTNGATLASGAAVDTGTAQNLTNKTIIAPTIASFANATHTHQNSAGGGALAEAALALTDVTTANASTSAHGFLLKLNNSATSFMNGQGAWATPSSGAANWTANGTTNSDLAGTATMYSLVVTSTASFGTGNGQLDIGSAGVRITSDGDGAITFLGLGDGSDEDFTINLDDTANTAVVSSSTGLNLFDFFTGSMSLSAVGIEVGHATDTTVTRSSAGNIAVEGNVVYRAGGTDVPVTDGGTGLSVGTSGGVPYFSGTTTIASSAALAANALVVGGGAGAAPATVTTGTGVLTAAAAAVNGAAGFLTTDGTATLTGKTYDAAATGNVLKFTDYKEFVYPSRVDGAGCTIITNDYTSALWGLGTFAGSGGTNANYALFRIGLVPLDLDTGAAMTLKNLAIRVSATDTDAAEFTVALWNPASSSAYSPSDFTALGSFINFDSGTLTSPAANDIFYCADVTLTGWAAALTAGRTFVIGIARRDGSNDDSVTIVSGAIEYGRTK